MNEKEKMQPKVRFREFTGENAPDWEQRKFNEIFTKSIINNTLSRADLTYDKGGIKNIHYGDILTKFDYCISSNDFRLPTISKDDDFVSQDELLENGDIVIADTAEDYTTGKAIEIVDCTNKIVAGLHTMAFRPNTKFASGYLGYYFNSIPYRKQLIKYIQGIKVLSISKSNINKTSLTFTTNYDEQLLISKLLSNVEKLITLHQRKVEQLEQLKNTLLSKMFPKSGTNIPEIRFSGFTDAWKQQRLGNISIMYQPETITSSELHNSGYPVFGANGYIGYFSKYNHKTDQVIISARGEKTGTANFVQGPIWITGNSMVINLDNSGVNKYFLYSNIKSFSLKKYITGGAQPQLTRDVLMKVPIVIPKINEQNNISKIFIKLDNYITIHQRKLEQLKNLKQTLLNKMFI